MPEARVAGAEKVTFMPGTGLANWSTIATSRAVPNTVPTVALWPLPATMVMVSPLVWAVMATVAVPQVAAPFLAVMRVEAEAFSSP